MENGYLIQERSVHDKRSIRVRLSDKGVTLRDAIEQMLKRHEEKLGGSDLTHQRLSDLNHTLHLMERFWAAQTGFSGAVADDFD